MDAPLVWAGIGVALCAAVRGVWSPCGLSMLSTITPVSERSRQHRYAATAAWFVVGAVAGGLSTGACAALLALVVSAAHLSAQARLGIALGGALVALAADVRLFGFRLPLHARQVDETWLGRYRPWVYGAGFGWQIGTGFATYIMTAAVYLLVLVGALTASPLTALALCAGFGLVRGLAVYLSAGATTPEALRAVHRRFEQLEPASRSLVLVAESTLAVAAAAALWTTAPALGVAVVGAAASLSPLLGPRSGRRKRRPATLSAPRTGVRPAASR